MKPMFRGWSGPLATVAAIVGVIVTVWIGLREAPGPLLTIYPLSQTSLAPSGKDAIPGLEFTIDKQLVQEPVLSVLRLSNDGGKPIPARDFETPVEITVAPPVKIVRVGISEKKPVDINPELETSKQSFKLKPTLLNPNDSITFDVLTAGGTPVFVPTARIVGVPAVRVATTDRNDFFKDFKLLIWATLLVTPSFALYNRWHDAKGRTLVIRRRTALAAAIASGFPGLMIAALVAKAYGFEGFWYFTGVVVLVGLFALPLGLWLDRMSKREAEGGLAEYDERS